MYALTSTVVYLLRKKTRVISAGPALSHDLYTLWDFTVGINVKLIHYGLLVSTINNIWLIPTLGDYLPGGSQ
jgi:hypothetical protein